MPGTVPPLPGFLSNPHEPSPSGPGSVVHVEGPYAIVDANAASAASAVTNYIGVAPRVDVPTVASLPRPPAVHEGSFAPNPPLRALEADLPKVCPTCGVRYPVTFNVCPRDATELDDVEGDPEVDEMVGKTIASSYTIIRVLGEGGMGRVYEARHTRISGKRFAVKMLHPEFTRQPDVLSRFQREAEAAATIDSPYVVDVYDVDRTADGRAFLVAEFLQGKEFASHLEEVGKMAAGDAVRIVRQICKALAAAHAKGIVHRDMKPENVFLTGDPAAPLAKVIDFGISKLDDRPGTALTKTGMIMGTPSYMAPEQARGERVDHRVDIYAVGAILYCALTGQRPFDRGDPTATLTAVLTQDPPRPRSLEPSIPAPLEMIIQRAMAKMPGDRYESMEALDEDLAPYEEPSAADRILELPSSSSVLGGLDDGRGAGGASSSWMRATSTEQVRVSVRTKQVRTVARARPFVVILSGLGVFGAAGALVMAITGILRALKGAGPRDNLTLGEAVLLVLGVSFTLLTPVILAVRHVARTVWGNSVKAVDLAETLRSAVLIGLAGYGFASLLVRLVEAVMLRHAVGVAWPFWDLVLFAIGLLAAAGAYVLTAAEKPKTT